MVLNYPLERFSIECRKTKIKVITLANHKRHNTVNQSRLDVMANRPISICIKIQPKIINISARLWGITAEFVGFIPQSLVLRSIVLGWILIYWYRAIPSEMRTLGIMGIVFIKTNIQSKIMKTTSMTPCRHVSWREYSSSYCSWARSQIFLCLERHTNEVNGSIQAKVTLSPRLYGKPLITSIQLLGIACSWWKARVLKWKSLLHCPFSKLWNLASEQV